MLRTRCFRPLSLAPALVLCLGSAACAVAPDHDYEVVTPAAPPVGPVLPQAPHPPGFATSPLVIAEVPSASHPKMRFVMRDGAVFVGQVLGFDGQMYALRLPHGTVLARKDFFAAVTPVSAGTMPKPRAHPVRPTPTEPGARY